MRLATENVSVTLGGRAVVRAATLALEPGALVGLVGPNGAGKSTLMRALAGLAACDGTVTCDGRPVSGMSPRERARHVAHLPQARHIGWAMTVENLVMLGRHPWTGTRPSQRDRAIVAEAMALMDVTELAARRATELSGGEQARVLAARAIAQDTPVLIADEPAAGLDPAHQIAMMQALRRRAAQGRAVMVSLHDLSLAARWCDRVVVMAEGGLAADGTPDILTDALLQDVFGISVFRAAHNGNVMLLPVDLSKGPAR
ncbi:MAG TPA: ABC transporter ATP-binding protein [Rhizobiaceae bacterium]|nr:ABC transporter ATP-binding protein [Rhizobiaceae bacterium]